MPLPLTEWTPILLRPSPRTSDLGLGFQALLLDQVRSLLRPLRLSTVGPSPPGLLSDAPSRTVVLWRLESALIRRSLRRRKMFERPCDGGLASRAGVVAAAAPVGVHTGRHDDGGSFKVWVIQASVVWPQVPTALCSGCHRDWHQRGPRRCIPRTGRWHLGIVGKMQT